MSNVIAFPTASERAERQLQAAFDAYDHSSDRAAGEVSALASIMQAALSAPCPAIRDRAARWLAEVLNVSVAA